ncbi:alkylresorcinol/alkylpyrone synthase [Microbacterium foliorum]|jgi:predicted naringenin-chalcone synthase|uniref:Alkylresorcinol/alkylpyrone synthase n=1 Tax=Microbacterium foliorum TaxID=104336 RepID=A0ABU1HPQ2_9MICO|nr:MULTISPECIES: type III polyketide synthase [Microbacterium]AQY02013.1 type III polyketide synthase [Microbacterium foliorum]KIP93351.1 naringenin-chalcone synthase [Microbacterium sp. MEJ108Y]MDR6142008.1 alkylresorcinol/alkylpyrone synthase [Microbacterium foliorum]
MTRSAVLRSLRTIVPDTVIEQHEVRDIFASQPDVGRLAQRIIGASFNGSGIDTRHTVIEELSSTASTDATLFFDRESGLLQSPGTAARNDVYIREASRLFVEVARSALDADPDIVAADVTHVITASCTGFHAPGPEYEIVRGLGLSDSVQRYHLGFMGCYASLPALRAASQFCAADPDAVVLVVSVELCTVHLRSSEDPDLIVANSLFADGAAAGIVTARDLPTPVPAVRLDGFHTAIAAEGEKDMAWTIGDHGFEMILSTKVPQIIGETIIGAIRPLYAREGELAAAFDEGRVGERVEHWAIHPGGRSILDRVQERLQLSDAQLHPARETLRENGNMSSATVLFVIKRILDDGAADGSRVAAMAFGPGLTAESALMTVTTGVS